MMNFYKFVADGYIVSVIKTPFTYSTGIRITEEEYNSIKSIIDSRPPIKNKFGRRLDAVSMEWEYYELPPQDEEPSDTDDDAIESDYIDALNTLGVNTNEEN